MWICLDSVLVWLAIPCRLMDFCQQRREGLVRSYGPPLFLWTCRGESCLKYAIWHFWCWKLSFIMVYSIKVCKWSEDVTNRRKYSIPVVEAAGEGCLTFRLLSVLLAVFCLSLEFWFFDAGGRLSFQAHPHLFHTEAIEACLALPDAGHRLNASSQLHLEWYMLRHTASATMVSNFANVVVFLIKWQ